jgi:hypothetical protein
MLIAGILLLLSPFFILSLYSHPFADDYSISFMTIKSGFWQYQQMMFSSWTGRYTANFLEALNPLVFHKENLYGIVPLLMLTLLLFSLYSLLRKILRDYYPPVQIFVGSLIFFALILNLYPGISEGIYWMTGATEYLLANILTLFCFSLLAGISSQSNIRKIVRTILVVVFAIMIAGLNEISALFLFEMLFLLLIYHYRTRSFISIPVLISLIFLVVATVIEISAPGNYDRMGNMSQPMNPLLAATIALSSFVKLCGILFQNPSFLLLSILFIPFAARKPEEDSLAARIAGLSPLKTSIISLLIILSLYVPQALAMGINPPLRVHGLIMVVFLWFWFVNLYILVQKFRRQRNIILYFPRWLVTVLAIAMLVLTLGDFYKEPAGAYQYRGNIIRAWTDLMYRAEPYEYQMQGRQRELMEHKGHNDTLYLSPFRTVPKTVFFVDITAQPEHWINASVRAYYETGPVVLQGPDCRHACKFDQY